MLSVSVLGEDITEALLWRRGAICYMYSHTVVHDEKVVLRRAELVAALKRGIEEL